VRKLILSLGKKFYDEKETRFGTESMRHIEKVILLTTIDHLWKDHLLAMDHLRDGIGLQGYGQKDPLIVYKKEGFRFFNMMMDQINGDVVRKIFAVQLSQESEIEQELEQLEDQADEIQYNLSPDGELLPVNTGAGNPLARQNPPSGNVPDLSHLQRAPTQMQMTRGPLPGMNAPAEASGSPFATPGPVSYTNDVERVGRNDACPCGSGKKYKKCHGINT
jgi:preprotein translocase subunit SecA